MADQAERSTSTRVRMETHPASGQRHSFDTISDVAEREFQFALVIEWSGPLQAGPMGRLRKTSAR